MTDRMIELVVVNTPNFIGLLILARQQWLIIRMLIDLCMDDDDEPKSKGEIKKRNAVM